MIEKIGIIIVAVLVLAVGFISFIYINDYKPQKIENMKIENNNTKMIQKNKALQITTFNIGYAGLDNEQDFFMDGGKKSRSSSKDKTIENLNGINNYLKQSDSDFYLIQEIDENSTRSFNINEYEQMKNKLSMCSSMAYNYKVAWVPVPIRKPLGKVLSGVASFSKYNTLDSTRYSFVGNEAPFPKGMFMLDRCMLVNRIKIEDSLNELVLVNAHLSAYDKGGSAKRSQLKYLEKFINDEYKNGNYVIVGGDWNHYLPGSDNNLFDSKIKDNEWVGHIPNDLDFKNFEWALDKNVPTCRSLDKKYTKGDNFLAVIDGFLVSRNINIINTLGDDLEFKYSDHNPVKMKFELR